MRSFSDSSKRISILFLITAGQFDQVIGHLQYPQILDTQPSIVILEPEEFRKDLLKDVNDWMKRQDEFPFLLCREFGKNNHDMKPGQLVSRLLTN